jgi:hypothetical protein
MKFTKEFLSEMMCGGWEGDVNSPGAEGDPYIHSCEVVREQVVNQGRWDITTEYIFEYRGHLYRWTFSRGATEQQDYNDWDTQYGGTGWDHGIEVDEVWAREVVAIEYMRVGEGEKAFLPAPDALTVAELLAKIRQLKSEADAPPISDMQLHDWLHNTEVSVLEILQEMREREAKSG